MSVDRSPGVFLPGMPWGLPSAVGSGSGLVPTVAPAENRFGDLVGMRGGKMLADQADDGVAPVQGPLAASLSFVVRFRGWR